MSLIVCDLTSDRISFYGDSAHPTEGTDPQAYRNDATKVLLSPDRRIGVGLAGTLNFPWENQWCQPEKWVDDFLRSASSNDTENPGTFADALKQKIELLTCVPFNNRGIVMIGGFANGRPELYELEVRSISQGSTTTLVAAKSQVTTEFPRLWGELPSWRDLLSLLEIPQAQIPSQPAQRQDFFIRMLESAVTKLRANGNHCVNIPIVPIHVLKPIS